MYQKLAGTTKYVFKPFLKNASESQLISKVKLSLTCSDPWVTSIVPDKFELGNLTPGKIISPRDAFQVYFDKATFPGHFNLEFNISSENWPLWVIDTAFSVYPTIVVPPDAFLSTFKLEQNYPNPFNSVTTIGYGIKDRSDVKITVLNAIGKEVAVLLNSQREAGYYEIEFNAKNLPGGVYFYQIKAGTYTQTKKMILLK
jgi:hypothetical protein